jgi:hypothetical protein
MTSHFFLELKNVSFSILGTVDIMKLLSKDIRKYKHVKEC